MLFSLYNYICPIEQIVSNFGLVSSAVCPDCDDYRNPPLRAMSDNTVKTVNTDTVSTVAKHGVVSATPPSGTNVTTKSLKDSVVISEAVAVLGWG